MNAQTHKKERIKIILKKKKKKKEILQLWHYLTFKCLTVQV